MSNYQILSVFEIAQIFFKTHTQKKERKKEKEKHQEYKLKVKMCRLQFR